MGTLCAGLFVFAIVALVLVYIKRQKQAAALNEYQESLERLKADPNNPDLRQKALQLGRVYFNLTRNNSGVTIYDELALKNDLDAACAGAMTVENCSMEDRPAKFQQQVHVAEHINAVEGKPRAAPVVGHLRRFLDDDPAACTATHPGLPSKLAIDMSWRTVTLIAALMVGATIITAIVIAISTASHSNNTINSNLADRNPATQSEVRIEAPSIEGEWLQIVDGPPVRTKFDKDLRRSVFIDGEWRAFVPCRWIGKGLLEYAIYPTRSDVYQVALTADEMVWVNVHDPNGPFSTIRYRRP